MADSGGLWTYDRIAQVIKANEGHVALIAKLAEEKRALLKDLEEGNLSDGAHTHNELYEHRMCLTAHAVLGWIAAGYQVVKSWRHSDGELCFGGGWFIVVAKLPTGWISYHYQEQHWDLFDVDDVEKAPEWDGHQPEDVIQRLKDTIKTYSDHTVELESDRELLYALQAAGVDNWEGYEIALEEMEDEA